MSKPTNSPSVDAAPVRRTDESRRAVNGPKRVRIKTYIVVSPTPVTTSDGIVTNILGVRLNSGSAGDLKKSCPGSHIEFFVATK